MSRLSLMRSSKLVLLGLAAVSMAFPMRRAAFAQAPQQGSPYPIIAPCRGGPFLCPVPVTYYPGWNLIAGTEGNLPAAPMQTIITGADGPLYTLQAEDSMYETVPASMPLRAGVGYWAYFTSGTPELLAQVRNAQPLTLSLPQRQSVMIGNPFPTSAAVGGADIVYIYEPGDGSYQQTTTLRPGQGAWAYSATGAAITLSPVSP